MTYPDLGSEIGRLVETKQAAYGDSFGRSGAVMRALYPDGVPLEKLDDALTVVRVLDKLFRIATDRDALGESPWRDIAGYALLAVKRAEAKGEEEILVLRSADGNHHWCARCEGWIQTDGRHSCAGRGA